MIISGEEELVGIMSREVVVLLFCGEYMLETHHELSLRQILEVLEKTSLEGKSVTHFLPYVLLTVVVL